MPRGRDLSNERTKQELVKLFEVSIPHIRPEATTMWFLQVYATNSDKLVRHGSSQANESFNNTVASKHPKSRSYASSSSFNTRVGCAVAQKNVGYGHVGDVSSKYDQNFGGKRDKIRKRESLRKSSKPVKRCRLQLYRQSLNKQLATEVKTTNNYFIYMCIVDVLWR